MDDGERKREKGEYDRRFAAGVVDDDLERGGSNQRMTRDSQSTRCPVHPADLSALSEERDEPRSLVGITATLPHTTELRLRSTTPLTKITCSITSVLCKHDSPARYNPIDLIKRWWRGAAYRFMSATLRQRWLSHCRVCKAYVNFSKKLVFFSSIIFSSLTRLRSGQIL